MNEDVRIAFSVFGRNYETTNPEQLDKDQIINCLANILTQIHRADNVRTSGSEFKHKIRTIVKEGRLAVASMMFEQEKTMEE